MATDARSSATDRALVLFSGGQDSATCLAWALDRFAHVETWASITASATGSSSTAGALLRAGMGRVHPAWAAPARRRTTCSTLDALGQVSETALTRRRRDRVRGRSGLPNTFVPGRNLVFLTFAAALAYRRGLRHVVGGMCETDYSGYPDCRDDTIKALQVALNLGMERRFVLHTPLMWLDKAQTWGLAEDLGGRGAGRPHRRGQPHLLSRRARRAARLGLRLRHLPGLRAAGGRLARFTAA